MSQSETAAAFVKRLTAAVELNAFIRGLIAALGLQELFSRTRNGPYLNISDPSDNGEIFILELGHKGGNAFFPLASLSYRPGTDAYTLAASAKSLPRPLKRQLGPMLIPCSPAIVTKGQALTAAYRMLAYADSMR